MGLVMVLALGLGGCVAMVDAPAFTNKATPSYADSMAYLEAARAEVRKKAKARDQFEQATKLGVSAGIAGTGINAIFNGNKESTLGLVTLGALSYVANQNYAPPAYATIYSAALGNFICIRQSASQAHAPYDELQLRKERIQDLLRLLRADLDAVAQAPNPGIYDAVANPAREAIPVTEALLARLTGVSDRAVAEAVIAGVDSTLDTTNDQLRASAPSIDTIRGSGKLVIAAIDQGLAFGGLASDAAAKLTTATGSGHSAYPLNDRLVEHQGALRKELDAVTALLATLGNVQTKACQPRFPDASTNKIVLLVGPTIDLKAGETVSLNTASDELVYPQWIGVKPTDVDENLGDVLSLTAKPDAVTRTYSLRVKGGGSKLPSDTVTLNVHAKVAAAPPPPQNPPQQNPPVQNPPADENGRPEPPPPRT